MSCTIEDCVKNGLLEQVSVSVPSDEVFIIGDERTQQEGGQGMTFGTCAGNSVCVVKGMEDKGESGWEVVGGFAFFRQTPEKIRDDKDPAGLPPTHVEHGLGRHVWVKKGERHFDPTWSRYYDARQDISPNRYCALTDQRMMRRIMRADGALYEVERAMLSHLEGLAERWGLEGCS